MGRPRGPEERKSVTLLAPVALAALALAAPGEAMKDLEDNSFLVEEAYNQEAGVVQHIATFQRERGTGEWTATFTHEWPAPDERHQLSYTLEYARTEAGRGPGDVALNYRYGAVDTEAVAVSPRVSLILPTGDAARGLGMGGTGLDVNVPVSTRLARGLVMHTNVGASWAPEGKSDGRSASVVAYSLAQSLVVALHPRLNLLVEALWVGTEVASGGVTSRTQTFTVSPGIRGGVDLPGDVQVVLGAAVPLGVGPSAGDVAVLGYLSVEFPYWKPAEQEGPQ
jgi:hypothetical protein